MLSSLFISASFLSFVGELSLRPFNLNCFFLPRSCRGLFAQASLRYCTSASLVLLPRGRTPVPRDDIGGDVATLYLSMKNLLPGVFSQNLDSMFGRQGEVCLG